MFGFLLLVITAVIIGLVIAYWYLRRLENERRRRKEPRVVPLPDKHKPVDFTSVTRSLQAPDQRNDAVSTPGDTDVDTSPDRDDLKRISGIGPKLERVLNANGIFRFRQIADWQDADIDAIDEQLTGFRGRIRRDDWVGQAKKLGGS